MLTVIVGLKNVFPKSSCISRHFVDQVSPFSTGFELYLCFNGHFPGGPGLAGTRMSPFWIY